MTEPDDATERWLAVTPEPVRLLAIHGVVSEEEAYCVVNDLREWVPEAELNAVTMNVARLTREGYRGHVAATALRRVAGR